MAMPSLSNVQCPLSLALMGDSLQSYLSTGNESLALLTILDEKILEKSRGNDDQITFGNNADQASAFDDRQT